MYVQYSRLEFSSLILDMWWVGAVACGGPARRALVWDALNFSCYPFFDGKTE